MLTSQGITKVLTPLLGTSLVPNAFSILTQTRSVRPTIKIDKETFHLSLDVHQFNKDELRVKARPEYIVIEGKQERKTKDGFVIRRVWRKFKLPVGCDMQSFNIELTLDGKLNISAKRKYCEANLPCETVLPIKIADPEVTPPVQSPPDDPCKNLFKK